MNIAILVLSCGQERFAPFRERLFKNLKSLPNVPIYFVFGSSTSPKHNTSIPESSNTFKIIAPCEDYYEDIPRKMYYGFHILTNLGYNGIIKLDENIEIKDANELFNVVAEELKTNDYLALKGIGNKGLSYSSSLVNFSFNHVEKVHDKRFDILPAIIPLCPYAGGPAYAVSRKALLTLQKTEYDRAMNEDTMLAFNLYSAGINVKESKTIASKLILDTDNVEIRDVSKFPIRILNHGKAHVPLIGIKPRKRLYVDVDGGLGNQLFQIAVGLAYAQNTNRDLFLISRPANIRGYYWDTLLPTFKPLLLTKPSTDVSMYKEPSFGYRQLPEDQEKDLYLHGYFQSSKYCLAVKELMKSVLFFPPDVSERLESKYGKRIFDENVVLVHARQGDYCSKADYHGPLNQDYYKNAKACVEKLIKDPFYVLISDDDFWTSNNVFGSSSLIFEEDTINTLWFIMRCPHIIMANSTFSWWGTFLGTAHHVWAPTKWFGPRGPTDYETIYESEWVRVSTERTE